MLPAVTTMESGLPPLSSTSRPYNKRRCAYGIYGPDLGKMLKDCSTGNILYIFTVHISAQKSAIDKYIILSGSVK